MIDVGDAHLVICPEEKVYLDRTGAGWVKERAKAGFWPVTEATLLSVSVNWPFGYRYVRIHPVIACQCCGALDGARIVASNPPSTRCEQHVGRNPCAIEGCRRTREGKRPSCAIFLCGRHWRLVPRPMKLVYSRIWRLARKSDGWTNTLIYRERRIWARMVSAARAAHAGGSEAAMDMGEIEKMFG